jgi:WS/DGAT/MGAT family acyltransferase
MSLGQAGGVTSQPRIDRASANDLMQRAVEAGSVPMQVGACLVLAAGSDGTAVDASTNGASTIGATLADRVQTVPRLRQRLVDTPFGCGRPVWVDDARFDPARHLRTITCPEPGDDQALLTVATELLGERLPHDRPLWSATVVTSMAGGRIGLVIVFDHVLADGIGGLAVLAHLVDDLAPSPDAGDVGTTGVTDPTDPDPTFPRPAPSTATLALDAARARWVALTRWRSGLRQLRAGIAPMRTGGRLVAPKTSLNRPTGRRRATRAVDVDLETLRARAHAGGGTVNDAVLAGVTGALRELLRQRGDAVDHLVVSMPVSTRAASPAAHAGPTGTGTGGELGNEVGVAPVDLPATGTFDERLARIAAITRAAKAADAARVATTAVIAPVFRLLGALRLIGPFMDHQRLINTIVTNLRGPTDHLHFAGARVERVVPVSIVTGNVTVGFAVLSYAGTLTVTINADADRCPDLDALADLLAAELDGHRVGAAGR